MTRYLLPLFVILLLLPSFAARAQVQTDSECYSIESPFYREGAYPLYEYGLSRLRIVNSDTGDTIFELPDAPVDDLVSMGQWSPGCRYYFMRGGQAYHVWDTITGQKMGTLPGTSANRTGVWDERGQYLLVPINREGIYIWEIAVGRQSLLEDTTVCLGERNIEWDYEGGVVFFMQNWGGELGCSYYGDYRSVLGYSIATGQRLEQYNASGDGYMSDFFLAEPGRFLVTVSRSDGLVRIYERATGQETLINVFGGIDVMGSLNDLILSPDGRFFAIGRDRLRIWDVDAVRATGDYTSLYNVDGPESRIYRLRFIDNTTIETVTYYNEVQRWDARTGLELP
jgi:WD40 repeat protein